MTRDPTAASEGASAPPPAKRPRRWLRVLLSIVIVLVVLVGVGAVVFITSYRGYTIVSGANEPTLRIGDHVLIRKGEHASRNQFVVLAAPAGSAHPGLTVIFRVVGVAGDRLTDVSGVLRVNGTPSVGAPGSVTDHVPTLTVPVGTVYVLGDNREDSADSRYFGPVPDADIKGHVVFRYWPPSRAGSL